MNTETNCSNCVFFDQNGASARAMGADSGLCRINPPAPQPDANAKAVWPSVRTDDWCGQHTALHRGAPRLAAE